MLILKKRQKTIYHFKKQIITAHLNGALFITKNKRMLNRITTLEVTRHLPLRKMAVIGWASTNFKIMSGHLTREEKNLWKEQVETSRRSDFDELKNWLIDKKVSFKEFANGVELGKYFVSDLLKVYFQGTRKGYQYNLDGIKERIIKDFGVSL